MKEGNKLSELLSSFSCEKDEDIEYFLHNRAIEFEKLSKARTYLVLDQEQLKNKEIEIKQQMLKIIPQLNNLGSTGNCQ